MTHRRQPQVRPIAAISAALLIGTALVVGIQPSSAPAAVAEASPIEIHLQPGERLLVIADTPAPSGVVVPSDSPTPVPSLTDSPVPPTQTPSQTPSPTPIPSATSPPASYVGFGNVTTGGNASPLFHVTNLFDSGTGSLRDAVSASNRHIVFDVEGTISVNAQLYITGSNITIDGASAPGAGITLSGHTLYAQNSVHDIIISNIRHRGGWSGGQEADDITLARGVNRVILDHVSVSGYFDEGIDLWDDVHDVTISNSIIGPAGTANHNYANLIGKHSYSASIFNVLYYQTGYRNPAVGWDDATNAVAPQLMADIGNIFVYKYQSTVENAYGTTIYHGGTANLLNSLYRAGTAGQAAVSIETSGKLFQAGNQSLDGKAIAASNVSQFNVPSAQALPVVPVSQVVGQIKTLAGAFPRDSIDMGWLTSIPSGG